MKIRIGQPIASIAPASVSSSLLADAATAGALSDVPPRPFYSLAAHPLPARETPSRGGSECVPATISAFVEAWISPRPKAIPREVDFSFKRVIGEPEW